MIKRCLECRFTVENPEDTPESILARGRTRLCVESPPSSSVILLSQSAMARVTNYPVVASETVSCSRFACETGKVVLAS